MERKARGSVTAFYALALGLAWAGWIPSAAAKAGILPMRVAVEVPIVAQFGPSVAALMLTAAAGGFAGLRDFLARSCRWRVGFRWYAIALLLSPAIAGVVLIGHAALGYDVPRWAEVRGLHHLYVDAFGTAGPYAIDKALQSSAGPIAYLQRLIERSPILALLNFIMFAILTGPVSEEFGWRGYALPRLQLDRTAWRSAVTVGVLWGFWHTGTDFWRLLFEGNVLAFLYPIAITMGTVPLSVLFTWMFNQTGGSVLPPMLCHASFNSTVYILTLIWVGRRPLLISAELVVGLWIAVIVVVVANGPATLARHARAVTP